MKGKLCILALAVTTLILTGCGRQTVPEPPRQTEPTCSPTETQALFIPDYSDAPGEQESFIHSHPLGTTARYDLNGDRIGEDISVETQEYEGTLTVGGAEMKYQSISPTGYFAVLNVDPHSNQLLIGISDYGYSDDFTTVLYAYDGESITEVGFYEDITGSNEWGMPGAVCNGDGTISAKVRFDVLGTWGALALYRVESGKLKDITDFYEYLSWEEQPEGWEVTTKADIIMYAELHDAQIETVVPAGTPLVMTGIKRGSGDGNYEVCFRDASGENTLWMRAEVVQWYTDVPTPEGMLHSEDAFDGFFYAG